MSHEFDGLDATEKSGILSTLIRCRVLAAKIANELRNKKPELADFHASLEHAADVIGQKANGRSRTHLLPSGRVRRRDTVSDN